MAQSQSLASPPVRLGPHHFVYLRAVSEGMSAVDAAKRWLGIEHAAATRTAHRALVEQVRAIARRRGDSRWRLLGLELRRAESEPEAAPTIDEWAEAEGLADWSQHDLQEMYVERFGAGEQRSRREVRAQRLREKRLALLRELESTSAVPAKPTDLLEGWLQLDLAEQLKRCGMLTLADLQARIERGGRWWTGLLAFGPTKAARLASLVQTILPRQASAGWPIALASRELARLDGSEAGNRAARNELRLVADNDRDAMRAWIAARAGSLHTAVQYEREAERFILFCVLECGRAMSDVTAEHCRAYMDFLVSIPDRWISRKKVPRLTAGWAPFRDQLSLASQSVSVDRLNGMFGWLVKAGYLASNPWTLVNRRLGDEADALDMDGSASRALTRLAWTTLIDWLEAHAPTPSNSRLRWLCLFEQAVGLRAAELLRATRGHMKSLPEGWVIRVHGKGRRNRTVPVPRKALGATVDYFRSRGLEFEEAAPETPLLASLVDPREGVSYSSLAVTFRRFVRRAVAASSLSATERLQATRASAHWLRHTHATRAAEAGVPLDVLQENLGQADPRTTALPRAAGAPAEGNGTRL